MIQHEESLTSNVRKNGIFVSRFVNDDSVERASEHSYSKKRFAEHSKKVER